MIGNLKRRLAAAEEASRRRTRVAVTMTKAELEAAAVLYAEMVGDEVDPERLAAAEATLPDDRWHKADYEAPSIDVSDRFTITPDMPIVEAARRYADLLDWHPPRRIFFA